MDELQKKIKKLRESKGWKTSSEILLASIQEELGEVAGSYLAQHPDYKKLGAKRETLENEIGDLLVSIISFCNEMDININDAIDYSIKKIANK